MKKVFLFSILSLFCVQVFSQSFNESQVVLSNYLKRMYEYSPFEGVRIVEDYDNRYLISVLSLKKSSYQKESDMFRVAKVKALREAGEFVSGGTTTSDVVIRTTESESGTEVTVETVDKMRTVGFVQGMELLNNFSTSDDTEMVFIYIRLIESLAKPEAKSDSKKKKK